MKINYRIGITLALILTCNLPLNAATANASTSNILFKPNDCRLIIEDAHISNWLLKNKKTIRAVKANVTSECEYPQQKVIFKIFLNKKIGGRWVMVQKFTRNITNPKPSPFRVEVKDAWVECKNLKKTRFVVTARSWTTIAGKEYSSLPGVSANEKVLNCGV